MSYSAAKTVLPIAFAFLLLVGAVGSVIYYGRRRLDDNFLAPGTAASVAPFSAAAFAAAQTEGRTVVLYFDAPWCAECDFERQRLAEVLPSFPADPPLGFIVELGLEAAASTTVAGEFGVREPNTKIIFRGAAEKKRGSELWTRSRYLTEIKSVMNY